MPAPSAAETAGALTETRAPAPAGTAADSPAAGRTLGRFRLGRALGRGGMGTVYEAFDPTLERPVALKVPRFDAAGDPDLRRQFLREARAAAAVRHPHLVEVYEAGLADGPDGPTCYLASQLCDGPDLAAWLAGREERGEAPVTPAFAAALLAPLAAAVHCCHGAGVVHRDLKPANVLLDAPPPGARPPDGSRGAGGPLPFVPKVADFGVALALEDPAATTASRVIGTPLYMAPEQAAGRSGQVGPATDVWALGAILYELLTGRPPFAGRTTLELLRRIEERDPPPPRSLRPGVPAPLAAIALTCLRKRPADRYPTAAALADDLDRWRAGRPVSARRWTAWDRFDAWTRRPRRVRDAGALSALWNGLLTLGIGAIAAGPLFGWATPLPADPRILTEALIVAPIHLALTVVGWRAARGDRWAWRLGFAAAVVVLLICLNGLAGGGAVFGFYDALPAAKYLMMLTFTALSAVQAAAFLLGARAERPA